jgi:hypothetical protein
LMKSVCIFFCKSFNSTVKQKSFSSDSRTGDREDR